MRFYYSLPIPLNRLTRGGRGAVYKQVKLREPASPRHVIPEFVSGSLHAFFPPKKKYFATTLCHLSEFFFLTLRVYTLLKVPSTKNLLVYAFLSD